MARFLIVRLGSLGDIVHAIPVAAALRRAHPDARIDWLVSAKHSEILKLVPVIDRHVVVDDGMSLWSAIRELRKAQYDAAIDLQGLLKSALIARASGAPVVIGFSRKYLREPIARLFYTLAHDPGGDGMYAPTDTRHVLQINLGLLESIGVKSSDPEFPIVEIDSRALTEVRMRTGPRFVLLNPGAAWPNKRWPPERLGALSSALRSRHGLMSAVLWGPGERALAEFVVANSDGAAVLTAETSISDLVALARAAAVMVSGDTGPTHVAAAVGAPIVGIYGPTRPERNGPWRPQDETVSRVAICQCHHLRRCKLDTPCLMDIQIDEVLAAVERRLACDV